MRIEGKIVDIINRRIFEGEIIVESGKISAINEKPVQGRAFLMPGFIDAHIHIESSMLVPSEFAKIAVTHGTVATVSDPHEIANVLGIDGVRYMIENGKKVPFKFHFGAPSCVPATAFETAGASIDANGIKELLALNDNYYLAEMMNYPGVLFDDAQVLKKIEWAKKYDKPVDGHAPGLRGTDLQKYVAAGISTDHECFTFEEAREKLGLGMKILIREGSAAKNFEALYPLLDEHFENMMFCSDDKHPDDLLAGHINLLCARAVSKGVDVFKVLQAACLNPIDHYKMNVGKLREGDAADFILVEDLENFKVLETFVDGICVSKNNRSHIESVDFDQPNRFSIGKKQISDFTIKANSPKIRVIEALEGQLITRELQLEAKIENGNYVSDVENDILKMAVVNRYSEAVVEVAFVKNFGLKRGAIASSVAHDSHNIIAVGTNDAEICNAVNEIIAHRGGICAVNAEDRKVLPLPVAGIISTKDCVETARLYQEIDAAAKKFGSKLHAPFMTLSFMALLVIPDLKLSDKGLFSGTKFEFTPLGLKDS